jgi:all-trans-nonaprenyl-diphosphate synthase
LQQNTNHDLLRDILSNGRRDDGSIMTAVRDIRQSGAIEASLDDARQFIEHSRAALEILPQGNPRDALRELSDFVVERSW